MKTKIVHILGSLIVTCVLFFALFEQDGISDLGKLLRGVNHFGVFVFFCLAVSGALFRTLRYRTIFRAVYGKEKTPSTYLLMLVTFVRNACVDMLPARAGELVYVYMVRRVGLSVLSGVASLGVCVALDIFVLFVLLLLCVVDSEMRGNGQLGNLGLTPDMWVWSVFVAFSVLLSCVVYYADWFVRKFVHYGQWAISRFYFGAKTTQVFKKIFSLLSELADEVQMLRMKGAYLKLVGQTVGLRVCKYLGLYVLLLSVVGPVGITSANLPLLVVFVAFVAAEASASLPASGILGFGAYQGVWVAILKLSGVELPSHLSIAIAIHIITQCVGYSLGALAMAAFVGWEAMSRENGPRRQ